VAVLLEEVVLDLPHVVETQAICQLHLVEGVLEQAVFISLSPRAGDLVFVEQAELHDVEPTDACPTGPGREGEP